MRGDRNKTEEKRGETRKRKTVKNREEEKKGTEKVGKALFLLFSAKILYTKDFMVYNRKKGTRL